MMPATITSLTQGGIGYRQATRSGIGGHEGFIAWDAIRTVTVFKRDLFTYDLICLRVETAPGQGIEANEENPEWLALAEAMERNLPGCRPWAEWFMEVAFPAFEANPRVVFRRRET